MAIPDQVQIPSGGHSQRFIPASFIANSISVLNPNNGICFVARDRDCLGQTIGAWDWKIPSQSYAHVPGPFRSVGLYYLDQSGAALPGDISTYASEQKIELPTFAAIGRSQASVVTTLDIGQGTQPQPPAANNIRLWADAAGNLHFLTSANQDKVVIDSTNYATYVQLTVGDVVGPLNNTTVQLRNTSPIYGRDTSAALHRIFGLWNDNNPYLFLPTNGAYWIFYSDTNGPVASINASGTLQLNNSLIVTGAASVGTSLTVTGALTSGAITSSSDIHGHDFYASRGDTTGVLYFGNNPGNIYIYYNGSAFSITAPIICGAITSNGNIVTTGGVQGNILGTTNYIYTPTVYLNSSAAAPYIQNAGAAIRYWAAGVHSFEGNAGGSAYGNISCWQLTAQGNVVSFGAGGPSNIQWNGTYLNHSHSIQFNTTGNQIVWPNGSYISGNAGYAQGSRAAFKTDIQPWDDNDLLTRVLDPRMVVITWAETDLTPLPALEDMPEVERVPQERLIGFTVEDVNAVVPELVIATGNGIPTAFSQTQMIAMLWGALRATNQRIDSLGAGT